MAKKRKVLLVFSILAVSLFFVVTEKVSVSANMGSAISTDSEMDAAKMPEWLEDGTLKILTIGNSFSYDSMRYLYQIGKDMGIENMELGVLYIPRCSLETHLKNVKRNKASYIYYINRSGTWETKDNYSIKKAAKSEDWDFLVFQQYSGTSGIKKSYKDLNALVKKVISYCPNAATAWHMTWAYQTDCKEKAFESYDKSQKKMYRAIASAVKKKVKNNDGIDIVIPVGTAVQNARTSYLGDTLTRDGYHMSYDSGRYVAGVTFFSALTGMSPETLTFKPAGTEDALREVAVESAVNALKSPYKITESRIGIEDVEDISPKPIAITRLKGKKKKITVKWKKAENHISGYEIQYSRKKSFSNKKKVRVVGSQKTSKVLKRLSWKKTCWIRIRTYKRMNGKTYYSKWSAVKKVVTN